MTCFKTKSWDKVYDGWTFDNGFDKDWCVFSTSLIDLGIKEFSEWPTIPQIYMKGEFIGGCDILLQMHQSGEFIEELEKVGIKSALLDQPKEDENQPKDK